MAGPWEAYQSSAPPAPDGPWSSYQQSPSPLKITVNPISDRFADVPQVGGERMQEGLNQRGLELTRGPELPPAAQMAGDMSNLLPAATQGTTPHVSNYGGQLLSTETFEDDAGNILFRDPQTGKVNQTDKSKHVAIRDPSDGVIKVFKRTEATNENPAVGVSRVLAPGLAAGAVTARAAIPATNKVVPRASEIFATAKPFYRAFTKEAQGIEVPPQTGADIAGRVRGALDKANLIEELAPSVYKALAILDKPAAEKKAVEAALAAGKEVEAVVPFTLDALQNVKRVVGRSFASPDKNVRDAAAVASKEINKIIGEVSSTAGKNLKTGDAIHSTARSVQELQRKGDIAGLRTGRAGYGGNAVNNMRQVLSPIVQRSIEGRVTGFQPGEIAAMREIVEGTTATNALRQVGALSPAKGGLQLLATAGTAGTTGGLGMAANKLATVLTGKQIDRLNELVAKRSPAYAQAVAKAVDRFEKAQMELVNKPSPNKFAAYLSASRALSAGLQRDGIEITSGALLKSIQGPMKSAAEGDQPSVDGRPSE